MRGFEGEDVGDSGLGIVGRVVTAAPPGRALVDGGEETELDDDVNLRWQIGRLLGGSACHVS